MKRLVYVCCSLWVCSLSACSKADEPRVKNVASKPRLEPSPSIILTYVGEFGGGVQTLRYEAWSRPYLKAHRVDLEWDCICDNRMVASKQGMKLSPMTGTWEVSIDFRQVYCPNNILLVVRTVAYGKEREESNYASLLVVSEQDSLTVYNSRTKGIAYPSHAIIGRDLK